MDDGRLAVDERQVALTEAAARRISFLKSQEDNGEDLMLRLTVLGGGCSGFQYTFGFDRERQEDDHFFEKNGVTLVIDDTSLDLLAGSEVDFVEDLIGAAFQVRNPNASSSCGCGSSFAI